MNRIFNESLDLFEARLDAAEIPAWSTSVAEHLADGAHRAVVHDFVHEMFAMFPLENKALKRLEGLLCVALTKCLREPSESGLVIAGFGTDDPFPSMDACRIRGRIGGTVRAVHRKQVQISLDEPSHIETFAQDEQAQGFLTGITSQVRGQVLSYWGNWTSSFARRAGLALVQEVPSIKSERTREKIIETMAALAERAMVEFGSRMAHYESEMVFGPMLRSVAVLPKDEVGTLASSLVNVTSLRQKMSISDLETVGGPVDCALISPGDGFVG